MDSDRNKDDVEAPSSIKKITMPNLPKLLTVEEKKFLLAVERGDMPNVKRMIQLANRKQAFDINCVDSLGRGALTISIDQENLEMVELLIVMGVQTKDALLHAINVEFVEAVELLLEHEELIHVEGEPYSWQKVENNTASFTPDITPLILAAHRNNYEILKILLDRGATVPMPHDIKCGCEECIKLSEQDSLRQAMSRLNEYRALASPSLIALSSSDPILTAFQLSWELRGLAFAEPECKSEYMDLRKQCQDFAVDLLDQSRSSEELAIILNHDPDDPAPYEEGDHMKLARLELAITYKQKKFVAHPNIQQLLAAMWYEGVPGFRRKTSAQKMAICLNVLVFFPFYCMLYIIAPNTKTGKLMRKPFMKFLIHASSYLFFLFILILVSQRAEDIMIEHFGTESMKEGVREKYKRQRGNVPMFLEYVVLIYVIGFICEETHEIFVEGIQSYLRNMWNFIDFTRNSLYTGVILLRLAAYIQQNSEINQDPSTAYIKREDWWAFDFQLIAEGLFAAANIFSALKLVHLFSINPHLGPLQISLGRMVIDIVKFFFIYTLVLFAFACGLNQLLWYFSDLEKQKCYHLPNGMPDFDNFGDSCMKWRNFANVFESSQSLFWASFGLVDLSSFELAGIKTYTRFWGLLMFGSYSVINVIVLLNLLIAMMSNSYAIIDEHSDTEWKFARTKLWMSYFEESATLPPPFNIFPRPKFLFKWLGLRKKDKMRKLSIKRRKKKERERDYQYAAVMRSVVWRYVAAQHRKEEESPVTEDDVNELKGEISSFRCDLMEVLHRNGMKVTSSERREKAVLGKKNKIWERRLMKDFKVGPVAGDEDDDLMYYAPPPDNETPTEKFRRIAKVVALNTGLNKWKQVVKGACIASQIGHCQRRDSLKKQQNLQKAMQEAQKLSTKSPDVSRSITPINLPDTTGLNIIDIIRGTNTELSPCPSRNIEKTVTSIESDLINLKSQQPSPLIPKRVDADPNQQTFKFILGDDFIKTPKSISPKSIISSSSSKVEKNDRKQDSVESKTSSSDSENVLSNKDSISSSDELAMFGIKGITSAPPASAITPEITRPDLKNIDIYGETSGDQNIRNMINIPLNSKSTPPSPDPRRKEYDVNTDKSSKKDSNCKTVDETTSSPDGDTSQNISSEESLQTKTITSPPPTIVITADKNSSPNKTPVPFQCSEEKPEKQDSDICFPSKSNKDQKALSSPKPTRPNSEPLIPDENNRPMSPSTSKFDTIKPQYQPPTSKQSSPEEKRKSRSSSPNKNETDVISRSPTDFTKKEENKELIKDQAEDKSPLAYRNIHRVQDKKRFQPRTGWL